MMPNIEPKTKIIDSQKSTCEIEQRARELLAQHPYFRGRENLFRYEHHQGMLVVRGSVPTFHLKQLLQTVLKELEGVAWIDNRVDVVSSQGISSDQSRSRPTTSQLGDHS